MRVMALDYGDARIGIALSDPLKILAKPYETYHRTTETDDFEHLKQIIKEQDVDIIVVGLPLNTEGEEQDTAIKVRAFCEKLKNFVNLPIKFMDERMSSVVADEILKQTEKDWKKRKANLDAVSAMVILQDYLDEL